MAHPLPSQIDICNMALIQLGVGTISSLNDGTEPARVLSSVWDNVLQSEIAEHNWHFATKRVTLAPDQDAPVNSLAYQFTFPHDCVHLHAWDTFEKDWVVEGGKIHSNSDSIDIIYTSVPTQIGNIGALFARALSFRLAHEICYTLTNNLDLRGSMASSYASAVLRARQRGAIEEGSKDVPVGSWVRTRWEDA